MPADVKCMTHNDKQASGFCSRCQMPYCADCLDVEMGQPLCKVCKSRFSAAASTAASSAPMGGTSPFDFKGKGMDDDPLGLFGGASTTAKPKLDPPKTTPHKLDLPKPLPASSGPPRIATPPKNSAPPPAFAPATPDRPQASAKSPMDLDSLMNDPQASRPPFPALPSPGTAPPVPGSALNFPSNSLSGVAAVPKKNKFLSLVKVWVKYLTRHSYDMFEPLAWRLKVPTYVVLLGLAAFVIGGIVGLGAILNRPAVAIAETIAPIHFIKVNASQISEMDVVAYADLQNQLQGMGFAPLIQVTIPQLPSPNFFDLGVKDNVGTYSEILKTPGQITPHLSFVTVFTNGVWFSTNGWQGENQTLEYLVSEFFPKDTPDQLYIKHVQAIEKLKQQKDWQVSGMNENRYMAALSDHLRWFLAKKDLQAYKAEFAMWH